MPNSRFALHGLRTFKRGGMTPKWGFGFAMLPVGALCFFYQVHFGRTVLPKWPLWVQLFHSVFYSVSELRRACFRRRVSHEPCFHQAPCFVQGPLCPQIPHVPAPTFGGFRSDGSQRIPLLRCELRCLEIFLSAHWSAYTFQPLLLEHICEPGL